MKKAKKNGATTKSSRESPKKQWCFTLNNPTISKEELLEILQISCDYLVIGDEIGESGTPHLQGYLELSKKQRFTTVSKLFPPPTKPHLEAKSTHSTRYQAATYCKKDAKYVEFGTPPKDNKARSAGPSGLKIICDAIIQGTPLSDAMINDAPTYVRNYRGLQDFENKIKVKQIPLKRQMEIEFHYGKTDTGKTHYCFTNYPELFKKPIGKCLWFDGYEGQQTVLIDEFVGQFPLSDVLQLLDCWYTQVEIKCGHRALAATRMLLTSNNHPSRYYESKNGIPWEGREEQQQAFIRRFTKAFVYHARENIEILTKKEDIHAFFMKDPLQ